MRTLVGLLVLALVWPFAAAALTVREQDLDELVRAADAIVVGRVEGGSSIRIEQRVYTVFEITVERTLKGPAHDHLELAIPGGVDPEALYPVAQIYPDTPTFRPEERAFLFLGRKSSVAGAMALSSMLAGKVTVTTDAAGTDWVALGPSSAGPLEAPGPIARSEAAVGPVEPAPGTPVGPAGRMSAEAFAQWIESRID